MQWNEYRTLNWHVGSLLCVCNPSGLVSVKLTVSQYSRKG
jgi:hypothetical protein